jgi:hypothetical protein
MTASSGLSACIITTQNIESFLEDQHHKTITIPVAPLHKSYHAKIGLIVIVKMVFSQDYLSVVPIFLVIVTPVVVANVPRNRRQSPGNLVNRDLLYRAISETDSAEKRGTMPESSVTLLLRHAKLFFGEQVSRNFTV